MSGCVGLFFIEKTVGESVFQFPLKCTLNVYQTVRKAAERKCTCCVRIHLLLNPNIWLRVVLQ